MLPTDVPIEVIANELKTLNKILVNILLEVRKGNLVNSEIATKCWQIQDKLKEGYRGK